MVGKHMIESILSKDMFSRKKRSELNSLPCANKQAFLLYPVFTLCETYT